MHRRDFLDWVKYGLGSAAVTTESLICGSVTVRKAQERLAPRLRATISWFMS